MKTTTLIGLLAAVLVSAGCSANTNDEDATAPAIEDEVITKPSATAPTKLFSVIKRDTGLVVHELNTDMMDCADGSKAWECPITRMSTTVEIDREVATSYGESINAKTALESGVAIARGTLQKSSLVVDQVWIVQDMLGSDGSRTWATLSTICPKSDETCPLSVRSVEVNRQGVRALRGVRWGYDYPAPLAQRLDRALAKSEVLVYGRVDVERNEFLVLSVYLKVEDAEVPR